MKHYKDPSNNEIYAYESDGSQDSFINPSFVHITDEEAESIRTQNAQAAKDALTYAQKRAMEYPPFTDYIDGVVKNDQAQIDLYIAACRLVKEKYPKS